MKTIENCRCGRCTPTASARGKHASVAEAVASVNALVEKSKQAEQRDAFQGREVAAVCMSPKHPFDKSGGEVEKVIRTGPAKREFAEPTAYWATANQDAPRIGDGELEWLQARKAELERIADDPATPLNTREWVGIELSRVRARIEAIEASRNPTPLAGTPPTAARQFAEPQPYYEIK